MLLQHDGQRLRVGVRSRTQDVDAGRARCCGDGRGGRVGGVVEDGVVVGDHFRVAVRVERLAHLVQNAPLLLLLPVVVVLTETNNTHCSGLIR